MFWTNLSVFSKRACSIKLQVIFWKGLHELKGLTISPVGINNWYLYNIVKLLIAMKCILNNAYTAVSWEVKTCLDWTLSSHWQKSGLKFVNRCLLSFMKSEHDSFPNFFRTTRFNCSQRETPHYTSATSHFIDLENSLRESFAQFWQRRASNIISFRLVQDYEWCLVIGWEVWAGL